jgi:hypothetical protein
MKQHGFKFFLATLLCLPVYPAQAAEIDFTGTRVFASEKFEISTKSSGVKVYLNAFRPNSSIWLNFDFPDGVAPVISSGETDELNITGHLMQLKIKTGSYLPSNSSPILSVSDRDNKRILELFSSPVSLPSINNEGNLLEIEKLNFLLTPAISNGTFAMAIQEGKVRFFEGFPNMVIAFRDLSDSPPLRLPGGTARYAYLEKIEINRATYLPGIWHLLDSNFQPIGKIGNFKVFGQTVYPDGHDITTSPTGAPVVMSYLSRSVDSSWLDTPFKAPILDCVFSQLSNGRAVRSFSVWDWLNSNREFSKRILELGDRAADLTRAEKPIDFCHSNSIQYSKVLDSFVISLRNLDLVLLVDKKLENSTHRLYSRGSRQHFARVVNSGKLTAFGNYTDGKISKLQTWNKSGAIWELNETDFPVKLAYCGNAQILPNNRVWVGGGCGNFEKETTGILYSSSKLPVTEIARLKLVGSSGSYRVDVYKP